jgi:cell fate (sporulation/competence/biofilm development) regulator YlbF (YheA/YmcA/DUF963 family)
MEQRIALIQVDFANNTIIDGASTSSEFKLLGDFNGKRHKIDEELKKRFLNTKVSEFWNTDKDLLEFFQYFNDGTYFCQRKRVKYDFGTESTYLQTYNFNGANSQEAKELYELIDTFFGVLLEVKKAKIDSVVAGIDSDVAFYEQRMYKLKRQRQEMLGFSDWRILPDIEDSYEGEKDRWIKWRKWIRDNSTPAPSNAEFNNSGLEYFKYTYNLKFPIDPSKYLKMYPGGKLEDGVTDAPAFMDANDTNQWVKHDSQASTDFFTNREVNMFNLAQRGIAPTKKVTKEILDLMKELNIDEDVEVNWSSYFVDENEL